MKNFAKKPSNTQRSHALTSIRWKREMEVEVGVETEIAWQEAQDMPPNNNNNNNNNQALVYYGQKVKAADAMIMILMKPASRCHKNLIKQQIFIS